MTSLDTWPPEKYLKRFKDWKSLLIFTFGLPWAENSVVSMGKRFKLRGGSYQEASHALEEASFHCLRLYSLLQSLQYSSVITTRNKLMRLVTTVPQTFWGLLHTAKKFGNGLFTPKCVNCFPSTSYVGEINNATISSQFGFVIEELGQGNHVIFVTLSFSKVSPSIRVKTRSRHFDLNGSGLKRVFKKLPLSWRISVDGRPNRRNKAAF